MILEVENIDCFYGRSHVVRGVSLHLDAGEIVSLLGRNGAGKTTTIQAIVGLVRPRSGTITLMGSSITGRPPYEIYRRGVGWVPQGRRLFPNLTVAENIRLAMLKAAEESRLNGLERAYDLFPILGERRNTRAGSLSGGEQQMLAITRALVGAPRVLLLDEPTEGLSPPVIRDLMRVIGDIAAQGVAVLLAEQNIRVALSSASRHCILDRGEIRSVTATADLEVQEEIVAEHLGIAVGTNRPSS